jgi:SNF2 family DNA or RNA helicase
MAKTTFGASAWGQWFIEVLHGYHLESRLERGRSYANTGKVVSLEIKDGVVTAMVKGHCRPFYRAKVVFPQFSEAEKEEIVKLMEEDASLLAEIAAGELRESFLVTLKQSGIALIPPRWEDMAHSCSCPDGADTCKHIAALYYVLSREVDAAPHILFKLRGLDLTEAAACRGAGLECNLDPPFALTGSSEDGIIEESGPCAIDEIPNCVSLISSLLPPRPLFLPQRDFALLLAQFYHESLRAYAWVLPDEPTADEEHRASRSQWSVQCDVAAVGADMTFVQQTVRGDVRRHGVYEAFLQFRAFSLDDGAESYRFLLHLFKFLNLVICAGAFVPYPFVQRGELKIVWLVYDKLKEIRDSLRRLYACTNKMLCIDAKVKEGGSRGYVLKRGGGAVYADGKSLVNLISCSLLSEFVRRSGFGIGEGGVKIQSFLNCFFQGTRFDVRSPAKRSLPLAVKRWLAVLHTDFSAYKYRISLKERSPLVAAKDAAAGADIEPTFAIRFEVQIEGSYIPLKDAAQRDDALDILKAPTALSNYLPEIRELSLKTSIVLKEERLVNFLDYASDILARLGIEIALPKKLHRDLRPRLILRVDAKNTSSGSLVKYMEIDSLLNFTWQMAIGDAVLSQAEFETLVRQKCSVVRFKDQYIRIDPVQLSELFKKAESENRKKVTPDAFLREHFAGNAQLSVQADKLVSALLETKTHPAPPGLNATLRAYQLTGYNWILSLLHAGFGAILADDMGLGKTIQAIAVILHLKEQGRLSGATLIIAPAALLFNWERELSTFAPTLSVARYHGKDRTLDAESDILLTTYQTAVRDHAKLREKTFAFLIVDEAHLMKNEDTHLSQTIKQLHSDYRLALSGTPVENRLEDLRSLFDYIVPGYLGAKETFKKEYRIPIEVDRRKDAAGLLRRITAPFLLRRLKTDKNIISDLPDKIVCNEYSALEKEQAALYQSIVRSALEKIEHAADGAVRSALVLGLLTALKQVCDHPRVYDKESPCTSKLSGKATLLVTLLRAILDGGERTLIFSQYVETLQCLHTIIVDELGEDAPLYHGAMNQKARSQAIDQFQNGGSSKIMLVSLRAGGLGLNLTAASRVIHYDLWYNPAVEAQATDRAFRIGQTRNVFVHRLIAKNTFEEKIDKMLSSKKELADMTVASGESWLSKMTNQELKALFAHYPSH